MAGTGLSIITKNTIQSYNTAVNTINRHQKENIAQVESTLKGLQNKSNNFYNSIASLEDALNSLKKQIFLNQCMIDNWNVANPPYIYQVDILA